MLQLNRPVIFLVLFVVHAVLSDEIHQAVNKSSKKYANNEFLNTKALPSLKHTIQDNKVQEEEAKKFLQLLDNFSIDGYTKVEDAPFTVVIPKLNFELKNLDKNTLNELALEHLIPGHVNLVDDEAFGNLNHNEVLIKKGPHGVWTMNNIKVLNSHAATSNSIGIIEIDGYLGDRRNNFAKRNIQENNRYNEPQRLEMKNAPKSDTPVKENKISHLMNFLAGMKSGTKVFQHFLAKSNLSQILEDSSYTVLIPSDNAFQRWHPIDWGFYPFSVQEFTEQVLRNHFLQMKQPLKMADVKNMDQEQKFKTVGGEQVSFRNTPSPMVNNVTILSDFTLPNGNEVFIISEVLFVSEAVVSRLHQMHKDKETPPLLAFPWFGAQFLSHAFLALERDNRFTQITRFLNTAEIAQYIAGSNYTFFVPFDDAFEKYSFDILPDDVLGSEKGVKMLLNHFVKGRLYDRDLKDDEVFETVGGSPIRISRKQPGNVTVNRAKIVETEIFVYNLGTMFYLDDVLYSELLREDVKAATESTHSKRENDSAEDSYTTEITMLNEKQEKSTTSKPTTSSYRNHLAALLTTRSDVEIVPSEFTEQGGNEEDFLDDEIIPPKALPSRFNLYSPKK